jgi:hypothetical protein
MKKNLRNILALALGLMTTVSFAQDWNVDSRTRIDMGGDGDRMNTQQAVNVGTAWGGSDWGIVLSSDVFYDFNDGTNQNLKANVYEAYASTNLFGFATMNIGRQALSYGSGVFVSKNLWSMDNRNTVDGMTFDIDNDFVDLTLGLNNEMNESGTDGQEVMWLNASKSQDDWSMNLFYSTENNTNPIMDTNGVATGDATTTEDYAQMGLDFGYSAMGGSLDLNVSYNTTTQGESEGEMIDLSGTYNVNDDMSLRAGRTSIGDNGFTYAASGNMAGDWATHGTIGDLMREVEDAEGVVSMSNANQENLYIGGSYNMGAFTLGATIHTVTNTENDDYERNATQVVVGYNLGDNASLSYSMVSDDNGKDDDINYNYLTLTITP